MNNQELELIKSLRDKFDLNNINDYQSLLLVIRNMFFKSESIERYELYRLIDDIVNNLDMNKRPLLSPDDLINYFISEHTQKSFR